MLLFHLLTFDPRWLKSRKQQPELLFYDGICGLCHRFVRFALGNDDRQVFRYAPLQGKTSKALFKFLDKPIPKDSMTIYCNNGKIVDKSSAVVRILNQLGGLWRIVAFMLWIIPKPIRDLGYEAVGNLRNHLFVKPKDLCPVINNQKFNLLFYQ